MMNARQRNALKEIQLRLVKEKGLFYAAKQKIAKRLSIVLEYNCPA